VLGSGTLGEFARLEVRTVVQEAGETGHKIGKGDGADFPSLCLSDTDMPW
jgi:hypothetical protein